jgi:hypothetical protein
LGGAVVRRGGLANLKRDKGKEKREKDLKSKIKAEN